MPGVRCPVTTCEYVTPNDATPELTVVLLQLHGKDHEPTNQSGGAKTEKVKRPTISAGGTSEEWTYFVSRWNDCKTATKVSGENIVIQLLECCEETLRKDLTRTNGGTLTGKPEVDVLNAIKRLAVREENVMISRVQLNNMKQDRDEPIRNFAARIRGQASVCKYRVKCPNCDHDVNYTDQVLRDAITRGISDQEIQLEILGDQDQDKSLEDTIRFIEAKEGGKRSANRLLGSVVSTSATSSYRSQNKQTCGYCGRKESHGTRRKDRENTCPAFSHVCGKCSVKGHFEAVCRGGGRQGQKTKGSNDSDSASGAFDTLCGSTNDIDILSDALNSIDADGNRVINLDHHAYNALCDT